jgi:hypothetical protein
MCPVSYQKKNIFCILRVTEERGRTLIRYGSADPDPYQNVTDPQHWLLVKVESLPRTQITHHYTKFLFPDWGG